jgi:hypothetical protein
MQVNSWHAFTAAHTQGSLKTPVTAVLVAMHNMVTETVAAEWFVHGKSLNYCPTGVFNSLKSGILSGDADVQSFSLPSFTPVPGVPGLASSHDQVACGGK